jgi:hypothetical protein
MRWLNAHVQFLIRIALISSGMALLALALYTFWPYAFARGENTRCKGQRQRGVASTRPARWKLAKTTTNAKIVLALDDWVDEPRRASSSVRVLPTAKNRENLPLPGSVRVRAFLLGRLSTGERSLQFEPLATARRTLDGRAVLVELCARSRKSTAATLGDTRAPSALQDGVFNPLTSRLS